MKSSFHPTFCLQVAISRALASSWKYPYLDQYKSTMDWCSVYLTPQGLPKYIYLSPPLIFPTTYNGIRTKKKPVWITPGVAPIRWMGPIRNPRWEQKRTEGYVIVSNVYIQYTQGHIVVDHLQRPTACHVWLGVYRCLLIAHLLCEYLIVAKLGVVTSLLEKIQIILHI
jgi:hypothetical protein